MNHEVRADVFVVVLFDSIFFLIEFEQLVDDLRGPSAPLRTPNIKETRVTRHI